MPSSIARERSLEPPPVRISAIHVGSRYAGGMSEPINCPSCGASNPAGSSWCSLCFHRFDPSDAGAPSDVEASSDVEAPSVAVLDPGPGPERKDVDRPAPTAPPPPPSRGQQSGLPDAEEGSTDETWTCRFCEAEVSMDQIDCPVCGHTIYESFGGSAPTIDVEPMEALRRSALPGGGHFLVDEGLIGGLIMALTAISLAMGIYLSIIGVVAFGVALIFTALVLWALAAHDAFRIASGAADQIFLRPRVLSVVAGLWFILVVAAAVGAQRGAQ